MRAADRRSRGRQTPSGDREIAFNGKFLAQPLTGVQRAAGELLNALDRELQQRPGGPVSRWTVWVPAGCVAPRWQCLRARSLAVPAGSLHGWEQLALPWAARGAHRLVHLSGSASWWAPQRSLAMLHDAAVFEFPEAYRPAFVRWYRHLFRRLGRQADGLLSPSDHSRQRLAQALGIAPERLQRLALGADHLDAMPADVTVLARLGIADDRPVVLAVGSRNPTKNFARLLQAFEPLAARRPDLQLLLVGGERPGVFAADGLPAHPQVRWTGRLADAELKALYGRAALLAFPSLTEGFGLPPLEAMRHGCPVLAGRAGALPEVLGDAACWVDPLDVDAIRQGIEWLLDEPARAVALREQGRAQAARYPWSAAGERLRAIVEAMP